MSFRKLLYSGSYHSLFLQAEVFRSRVGYRSVGDLLFFITLDSQAPFDDRPPWFFDDHIDSLSITVLSQATQSIGGE